MSKDVHAVIAALRMVLQDAEARRVAGASAPATDVNRWIAQLPGAWMGRWRHLMLQGDYTGRVYLSALVPHVRATLAYLEVNRDQIKHRTWLWPFKARARPAAPEPIEAVFKDVSDPKDGTQHKPMRLIKK